MGKKKNLLGLALAGFTASTVHAASLEVSVSPGVALGLGASGISLGAGAHTMIAMPGLFIKSKGFSSGVGLLVNADVFFKSFINVVEGQKGDGSKTNKKTSSPKNIKQKGPKAVKIKKEQAIAFLKKNKQTVDNVDLYRVITPTIAFGGAIVSYNTISLGSAKFNVFAGPRIGYAEFKSQDALGYIYSNNMQVEGIAKGLERKGANALMPLKISAPKIDVAKTTTFGVGFKNIGGTTPNTATYTIQLAEKADPGKDGMLSVVLNPTPDKKLVQEHVKLIDRPEYIVKPMLLGIVGAGSKEALDKKSKEVFKKNQKKIEILEEASKKAWNKEANIKAITVGVNAGASIDFLQTSFMTVGLEASYQLDMPIKTIGKIDLTKSLINNINVQENYKILKKHLDKVEITGLALLYDKVRIAQVDGTKFKVFDFVSGTSKKGTKATFGFLPTEKGKKSSSDIKGAKAIEPKAAGGVVPAVITSNAGDYLKGIKAYGTPLKHKGISLSLALKTGSKIKGKKYLLDVMRNKLSKMKSVQTPTLPMMHKINLSIKLGMNI